jgi:uncharacterized protein
VQDKSPYLVRLRELPTERDLALEPALVRGAVASLPVRVGLDPAQADPVGGAAEAHLNLEAEGDNVFARGTLQGWVEVACSRCVSPVRVAIDEKLQVTFLPRHRMPEEMEGGDDELELTEDDLDLYPYDGQEIDLEPLLREQLILAVPFAPLCSEECRGLCPSCGVDLNREGCACTRTPSDPRLAALKDFKV